MANIKDDNLTNDEMLEAIKRSGYLLETELSEILSQSGFFVESNQVIKDEKTDKSREIDLLAEYDTLTHSTPRNERLEVVAKIKFVIEAKNNPHPMILMSPVKFSPNIELWETLKEVITETKDVHHSAEDGFFGKLIGFGLIEEVGLFSQYCTFKKKKDSSKDELMAWHPDEFHDALIKIVQYCDEQASYWDDSESDKYLRDFLYLPVIVLGGALYELRTNDNQLQPQLHEVMSSKLLYNYHKGDEPKSAIIYVATKLGFRDFLEKMLQVECSIEEDMKSKVRKQKMKDN